MRYIIILFTVLLLNSGCNNKNNEYLNGLLVEYESFNNIQNVSCSPIDIIDKHLCSGMMSVRDSLLVFSNSQFADAYICVINLNTGKGISALCPKGHSDNTYSKAARHFEQFEERNGDICLWVHNVLKSFDLVNITKSIDEGMTIYEEKIPFNELDICHTSFGLASIYSLDNGETLCNVLCHYKNAQDEEYIPNYLSVYNNDFKQESRIYKLYNKCVINPTLPPMDYPYIFLASCYAISPSKKYVAWGLNNADVVNILNLKNGDIKGLQRRGESKIEDMTGQISKDSPEYYIKKICCDNQYIYAMYYGHMPRDRELTFYTDKILVFDWSGNPVSELHLSKPINNMAFDAENSILYGQNELEEEIYKIDFKL